ncbi:MAG TPA: glycoside hydrolase family 3 N-terminal domain-containing protein [Spirochaetota bacterium]|nr:glycoside hydrolase family 3 N-terminal domain-containing protein [Spirochaetota bacterium]
MISQMFISGFHGHTFTKAHSLDKLLARGIGGLLFRSEINISNKSQFQNLVSAVNAANSGIPVFLCADEEGGAVHFFKKKYGFKVGNYSAAELGKMNNHLFSAAFYACLADQFRVTGLNFNFAPVVDLNINTNNPVIGALERSYADEPETVTAHALIVIKAYRKKAVLTAVKHFPGHGSSAADSHKKKTDISASFSPKELTPFKKLADKVPAVMIGHLYNSNFDKIFPASMSRKIIHTKLVKDFGFKGLIVSDDIEMKAVADHYSLPVIIFETVSAGCDLIVCGNPATTLKAVEILYEQVRAGYISRERILRSYRKIIKYKKKYLIM